MRLWVVTTILLCLGCSRKEQERRTLLENKVAARQATGHEGSAIAAASERGLKLFSKRGVETGNLLEKKGYGALACEKGSRNAWVVVGDDIWRFDLEANTSKHVRLPEADLCSGKPGGCNKSLSVDDVTKIACVTLVDGTPATMNGETNVTVRPDPVASAKEEACPFTRRQVRAPIQSQDCSVDTPSGPVRLLQDARPCGMARLSESGEELFSSWSVDANCNDYCYHHVVVVDNRRGRVARVIRNVESTREISWERGGTHFLLDGVLYDALKPEWEVRLGYDACWLGGE